MTTPCYKAGQFISRLSVNLSVIRPHSIDLTPYLAKMRISSGGELRDPAHMLWQHSTTQLGVLGLKINSRSGLPLGVSISGQKWSAWVWCDRRLMQLRLALFPDAPSAAAAIACAVVYILPTPNERKPRRDIKSGMQAAMPQPPCV